VTAGAEWRLRSNWSLMGRFDGEFGNGAQTYTGTARFSRKLGGGWLCPCPTGWSSEFQ
jgi:hypothetical protein